MQFVRWIIVWAGLGLLVPGLVGCDRSTSESRYPYVLAFGGGEPGWPVWGKTMWFDQVKTLSGGGALEGGYGDPPTPIALMNMGPLPVPGSIQLEWFSYRTETRYQVDVQMPEDFPQRVKAWMKKYPVKRYHHSLLVGYSAHGEASLWWSISCSRCPERTNFDVPIVRGLKAQPVAKERESDHCKQVHAYVRQGVFQYHPQSLCLKLALQQANSQYPGY